jgi:hypothetical protein
MSAPLRVESAPSSGRHRPADSAWLVSTEVRQDAQDADACLADDDWLYTPPDSPPAKPRPTGPASAPPRPTR